MARQFALANLEVIWQNDPASYRFCADCKANYCRRAVCTTGECRCICNIWAGRQ